MSKRGRSSGRRGGKQNRSGSPASGRAPGPRQGPIQLRIVGGEFRARKLRYSGGSHVRPMKDRTREAVFNLIGPGIRGTHVWDLFAGTGAMALEALSRGARSATLIERHLNAVRDIRANVATLRAEDRVDVIPSNVFVWARAWTQLGQLPEVPAVSRTEGDPTSQEGAPAAAWTVFCCPPYRFYEEKLGELQTMMRALRAVAPPDSIFVIEAQDPFDFQEFWKTDWKVRQYAPAVIGVERGTGLSRS